ncbi:hypothetical protein MMC30_000513 [Trapelia coarctata]|nr:hypothetical protein [Trapelia coarctata]
MEKLEGALLLTTELGPQLEMAGVKGPDEKYQKLKALYENPLHAMGQSTLLEMNRLKRSHFRSETAYKTFFDTARSRLVDIGVNVPEWQVQVFYQDGLLR